jgi:hypothetical protein
VTLLRDVRRSTHQVSAMSTASARPSPIGWLLARISRCCGNILRGRSQSSPALRAWNPQTVIAVEFSRGFMPFRMKMPGVGSNISRATWGNPTHNGGMK